MRYLCPLHRIRTPAPIKTPLINSILLHVQKHTTIKYNIISYVFNNGESNCCSQFPPFALHAPKDHSPSPPVPWYKTTHRDSTHWGGYTAMVFTVVLPHDAVVLPSGLTLPPPWTMLVSTVGTHTSKKD